jgi:wobble nucleotide-excising tRNase
MPNASQGSEISTIIIDLSRHPDKFCSGCQKLSITKKVNFLFGKNGTGKTTISDEILAQLSNVYDVCVFKDFDGVVENDRLNAVALGVENSKIQREIDVIDGEIIEIRKQIDLPNDSTIENLFTKAEKAREAYNRQDKKIGAFYSESAREIKNISNPQIAKPSYDKVAFQNDISKAVLLSKDSIDAHKNIIKADKKADVNSMVIPDIDLSIFLKSTNEILQSSVTQPKNIIELTGSVDKQNFARQGICIHERKNGEICAFCGNEISEERWQLLGNYFNDEVKKLENSIAAEITEIELALETITGIEEFKESDFYDKFKPEIKILNLKLGSKRNSYKDYLASLQAALKEKKKNLFIESIPLDFDTPENLNEIKRESDDLVISHNKLSLNLKREQENAKDALRYQEVKKILDEFGYSNEIISQATLKARNDAAQKALEDKRCELQSRQDMRKALILQTKDEEKIAEKINKLLTSMGVLSFTLKLVDDKVEDQKGQYQIKSHDESIRPITNLSRGEKNIIAFLYFIFCLESVDNRSKPKFIVLDDPMTSNDDTMQYLMIGEIQKLYQGLKDGNYFIVLTHNCHFYLNVRPNTGTTYKENGTVVSFYEKYGVHHLFSDGKRTTIKCITKGKEDFKTSYETLWKELIFLYDAEEATPDLMLSVMLPLSRTRNF